MSITIGQNIASMLAQRRLGEATSELAKSRERLSSGQRINRASDDAASLSIASKLRADATINSRGWKNVNDVISLLNIQDSALNSLTDIVQRQTELADQAANGSYSNSQRNALQSEYAALTTEYNRIIEGTQFNGINVLDASRTSINVEAGGSNVSLQTRIAAIAGTSSGTGTYATSSYTGSGSYNFRDGFYFLIKDLDSDGFDDVVAVSMRVKNNDVGNVVLEVFKGSAGGTLTSTGDQEFTFSAVTQSNERFDGAPDLSFESGTNNVIVDGLSHFGLVPIQCKFMINASGVATSAIGGAFAFGVAGKSTGDFNGDGFADTLTDGASDTFSVGIQNTVTGASNGMDISQPSASIATQTAARSALSSLSTLSSALAQQRSVVGSSLSRLFSISTYLQTKETTQLQAYSRLMDADMAAESAETIRQSIKQQISSAILAQANQTPALALQLLR